ncbi:hypothetical protein [Gemmatimonas sp.]
MPILFAMPAPVSPPRPRTPPPALHDRALQDLSFIRRTMEGAAAFTDVPGWGLVGVGAIALVAAPLAAVQPTVQRWLAVWFATAAIAAVAGSWAMWQKMRRRVAGNGPLTLSLPARKFLLGFWPAMLAGAVLTVALIDPFTAGMNEVLVTRTLPGLWLLLYGVGVTTAGAHSIRAVPLMGAGFLALGVAALFFPQANGNVMMALGFGALQIGFGVRIARRYGG